MKRRIFGWSLAALAAAALAYGLFTLSSVQEAIRDTAHAWEGGRTVNGAYTLETYRRDECGAACASFRVLDTAGGGEVYNCPESWRTMDLKGIAWASGSRDIQVVSGDIGTVIYFYRDGVWTTVPPPTPSPEQYPFADAGIEERARELLGRASGPLTEADVGRLGQVTGLSITTEDGKANVDDLSDLPRYFPGLERLDLTLYHRSMTAEHWAALARLERLKSLSVYAGEGFTAVEPPEGLERLSLAGGDRTLPGFVLLDPAAADSLPEGNLTDYARLCVEDWVFELVQTDEWDGESFWGGRLCRVLVSREGPEGRTLYQILDIKNRPNADAARSLLFTDVDFDGIPDLLVWLGHFGAQGAIQYACFLQREGGFQENVSFSAIANPAVDPERREILSSWRNSADSHSWGVFEYRDGTYVQTRELTEASVEDSKGLVWRWTVTEALPDGQWETTAVWRSDERTEEQIEDLIYNENSDWGIMTDRWRALFNGGLMADFSIYGD